MEWLDAQLTDVSMFNIHLRKLWMYCPRYAQSEEK